MQVYGGITFYLDQRSEIDAHLKRGEERFDELARESREANPLLYAKLDAAWHSTPA